MIYALAFVPVGVFFVALCWVNTRPAANYVGIPPSRSTILMRAMTRSMRLAEKAISEALLPGLERVAVAIKAWADAQE
jgi:hypothetical protein